MNNKLTFLLKYISMETYEKIINTKNEYILEEIKNNYRSINLNLAYLTKYGVKFNDKFIYNNLTDLTTESFYEQKIKELSKNLTKEEIITLLENI